MFNDNLSGISVLTELAKYLGKKQDLFYSYRFLFVPETIGSIAWLSTNQDKLPNIKGGLVATCLGDSGKFTYKKSRKCDTLIDDVVTAALRKKEWN